MSYATYEQGGDFRLVITLKDNRQLGPTSYLWARLQGPFDVDRPQVYLTTDLEHVVQGSTVYLKGRVPIGTPCGTYAVTDLEVRWKSPALEPQRIPIDHLGDACIEILAAKGKPPPPLPIVAKIE